ncbi:hypothetical protein AB0E01_40360 [Nocardia vinacea]|uniref:hypothetical protein n=1 Tax=Nocardia vinacea TaxID=96468 RepID=UPI0033F731B0
MTRIVCDPGGTDGHPVFDIYDPAETTKADIPRESYAVELLSRCQPSRVQPAPHPAVTDDPLAFACNRIDFATDRDSYDNTNRVLIWILFRTAVIGHGS